VFVYLLHIWDVPLSVSAQMSTAINTVVNVFPQFLSENVVYAEKQATPTSFFVLILSFTVTLNIRRCITSAVAKHRLIKQDLNSKPEGRKAVEIFVGLLPL
jgi:hypothetical protein